MRKINNKSGSNPLDHELEHHKLQITSSPELFHVKFKGMAEQTFIFLDTPDPWSYKKTHGQAVVQKDKPASCWNSGSCHRRECMENVSDCASQNYWSGWLVVRNVFQSPP